jgi:hypothetical protein
MIVVGMKIPAIIFVVVGFVAIKKELRLISKMRESFKGH